MFNVIEKFLSIDGEGPTSGELSTFIRFQGCNLRCSWCDTRYSWCEEDTTEILSKEEIYEYIKLNGTTNVTLTGGEPLIQEGIDELLEILNDDHKLRINIETNGSVNIKTFKEKFTNGNIRYILDYKLPSSYMTNYMDMDNVEFIDKNDVYKFVIGNKEDLKCAKDIINKYNLISKCMVYFSPVLDSIELTDIVDFMKENNLNGVKLQLQLHKIIWDKDKKGV